MKPYMKNSLDYNYDYDSPTPRSLLGLMLDSSCRLSSILCFIVIPPYTYPSASESAEHTLVRDVRGTSSP